MIRKLILIIIFLLVLAGQGWANWTDDFDGGSGYIEGRSGWSANTYNVANGSSADSKAALTNDRIELDGWAGGTLYNLATATPSSANYSVSVDAWSENAGDIFMCIVRGSLGSGNTLTGYALRGYSAGNLQILRYIDGSSTQVAIEAEGIATTASHKYTLKVYGTGATVTLKAYYDGDLRIATTDTSGDRITSVGNGGIIMYDNNQGNNYQDNFSLIDAGPYYIRIGGSDTNDGISDADAGAWASLSKAFDTLNLGEICYVQEGTYNGCTDASGPYDTSRTPDGEWNGSNYAVIQANADNTSDIIILPDASNDRVLGFTHGAKYWKILGKSDSYFKFDGTNQTAGHTVGTWTTTTAVQYIWLEYLKITQGASPDSGNNAGLGLDENNAVPHHFTVKNCVIYQNYTYGIYTCPHSGGALTYHLIDSCTVYDNGRHGITMDWSNNVITNNIVYSNGHNYGADGGDFGIFLTAANNNIIAWNLLYNNAAGGIGLFSDVEDTTQGNIVHANILYDNGSNTAQSNPVQAGIYMDVGTGDVGNPTVISNNDIYSSDCADSDPGVWKGAIVLWESCTYVSIINNIVGNPDSGMTMYIGEDCANITVENNIFMDTGGTVINDGEADPDDTYTCAQVPNFGTNNTCQDPIFVDPGSEDSRTPNGFALQATSPCIDAGVYLSGYDTACREDITFGVGSNSATMPNAGADGKADIGAFPYPKWGAGNP